MLKADKRGVTLLDTVVGTALMLVIFVGIAATFQLSVEVVTNNKARAGAIALANERMEYIRSLTYATVGTSGGIPSGSIPQSETMSLNGTTYTRRTLIEYVDDPKDGTGASDTNNISEDYKVAKVDISWISRTGVRHIIIATRVTPANGMESNVVGGILRISTVNSLGQGIVNAQVVISNASTTPAINLTTFSNASGTVSVIGVPVASNYQITVSKTGYSSAQTYSTTAQNTNPSPANLSVTDNNTTAATFAIDLLGSKTIQTWTQILSGTWSDTYADSSKVSTSTFIDVSSGSAHLSIGALSGHLQSIAITVSQLAAWKTLTIVDGKPGGSSLLYHVYDGSGATLIPDAQLPGNSAGFASTSVSLTGISTTTYPSLRFDATLTSPDASTTPLIDRYDIAYDYGPNALPNIAFNLQGAKTTGSGPSGIIYKYSNVLNTGLSGSLVVPNLEWDNYTTLIGSATGYDIASSCAGPQPESLSPGVSQTTNLYLTAHTANSLLVDVRSNTTGALIPSATVVLSRVGFTATSTSDSCGQAFFGGLTASSAYNLSVSASGYTTYTASAVNVSGTSVTSVTLN